MPALDKQGMKAPVYVTVALPAAAGLQLAQYVFVSDGYYEVIEAREAHTVAGGSGAAMQVRKCAAGTAPGSGTAMLGTAFDLNATADTPQYRSHSAGNIVEAASQIEPGQSIAVSYAGTLTGLLGVGLTLVLRRTRSNPSR